MKYLGVDYGTKRVGLAVGEDSPFFVEALCTVKAGGPEAAAGAVAAVAAEEETEVIVIGMPYALPGGDEGEIAGHVRRMVLSLEKNTGFDIRTEDERMTTALVQRLRRESGRSSKKFDKDAAAAAAILETYIERVRRGGEKGRKK
ncbi:MAG: Holliday junction resolvase RuvX [Patescibacteria group bacterium]|nr:Holliday junction resolvase RuvX [Patescibacteria group bacterium]